MIEVKLPDLGEGIEEADIVNVLVQEGDMIEAEQSILELETDKALVELPSPAGGRVAGIQVQTGDKVKVGQTILTLEPAEPSAEKPPKEAPKAEIKPKEAKKAAVPGKTEAVPRAEQEPEKGGEARPQAAPQKAPGVAPPEQLEVVAEARPTERGRPAPAGPATRRLARELGVDISKVRGSGPGGRITEEDVRAYVRELAAGAVAGKAAPAAGPKMPDFSEWGPIERQPLSGIRRRTAENVSASWQQVPHVTQHDLADITEFEAVRKRYRETAQEGDPKLTITALALKVASIALQEFPRVNASVDPGAGDIVIKKYYHIGVAVDTEHGLLVPVIRDVDRKAVLELAAELEDVSERARSRKLDLAELRGGTFTITNLGGIGGTAFTPIVNWPEAAILGLSRARMEAVVQEGGETQPRLLLPLSLSYDHRVIDGAEGARFLRRVALLFSEPFELVLRG